MAGSIKKVICDAGADVPGRDRQIPRGTKGSEIPVISDYPKLVSSGNRKM